MSVGVSEKPLTPTEDLVMEVLAARWRTGERHWTFPTAVTAAVSRLARRGLVEWKSGIVEWTILVWLTDAGRDVWLKADYRTPDQQEIERLRTELRAVREVLAYRGVS